MKRIFLWISIVLILVWTLLPFYSLIVTSIAASGSIGEFIPKNVTFEYYKDILFGDKSGSKSIWGYMLTSVIIGSISTVVVLIVSVPAAYGFSRWRSRTSTNIYLSYFVLRMLPPIALVVPRLVILGRLGLIDTFTGLALIYIPTQIPLGIWLMKGFFDGTPKELEENAWVEGAGVFKTFWKIVLPINGSGIAVTAVFVFIYCYIEFLYASLMARSAVITLPTYIAGFSTPWEIRFQLMLAAALISILPMVVLFGFAQRYIVRGITGGALKY
jgi:multiple sugar transport system permease protein